MTVKHKCTERVWNEIRWIWLPCSRNATVQHDDKWYCWQHDPSRAAKKAIERQAAEEARADRRAARYARRARNARLGPLVTEELAALLEQLADYARETAHCYETARESPDDVNGAYIAEEIARATAARIRAALALEGNDES